jgi:hypothetical protein
MKKGILELIKKIYGSNALSKVLGTRTNVIRLPDNELKQYTNKELNIEAASDKLAQKAKADINELLAEYPRMNDAEKLIFEGNLTRLGNKLGVTEKGPAADVIKFGTGEKVSPEGVMSLTEKIGQKNAPGTLVGNLESRIKQLEAGGEELSKLKGKTYDEFMKDITQGQKAMRKLEDEGLVRAAAREIINKDIKSGKIKLPKEIEQDMVQGGGEPINVLRQFYGEGALEQLDSMIPEFKKMYSPKEAADAATKKFKFEFKADRPPGSTSIKDAKKTQVTDLKTEATKRKSVDDLIDEYNANQDRLRLSDEEGGTLIGYEEYEQLRKRNKDISKALENKGISSKVEKKPEAEIIPFTNKPDPEDFATGGRVGYKKGGITALKSIINFLAKNRGFGPTTGSKSLQELNPKQFGWKFNLLSPELKKSMEQNRLEYLENLSDAIKSDKKLLTDIKNMPKEWQEFMYKSANEGANQGRLDVYKKINIDDAISEIEQMKKNLEFKNLPGKEIKRRMNAEGGVSQGLDYLAGIERREYAGGGRMGFKKGSFLINTAIDAAKNLSKKKTKKPNLKRQLTDDEIDDLAADVGELDAYDFDGTVGSAEKIRKQHKEYMDYMYYQYKTGRLDPKPGEMNTSRMQYLRNKRKQAEMTDDPKLFNPNERDELDNLEETFSPMGTSNKINISDPKTAESFTEFAKQNDPEGFKKIEKIVDDINNKNTLENFDITGRKKNAKGGLNYLMGL